MKKKAAYFLLLGDYFGRHLDDGVIRALLASGYKVDIFAPDLPQTQTIYPKSEVHLYPIIVISTIFNPKNIFNC
ncbi:hypothetical protein QUF75_02595 [Desulfococcaceae bacterium HSG7]|nr:hypothetical protein [Desulfococcaceae bacterium HSG7]